MTDITIETTLGIDAITRDKAITTDIDIGISIVAKELILKTYSSILA